LKLRVCDDPNPKREEAVDLMGSDPFITAVEGKIIVFGFDYRQ
jgi:hypothetical protein